MVNEDEIRRLAERIWEVEGFPRGRDWDHYFRAKGILEESERVEHSFSQIRERRRRIGAAP